MVEAAALVQIEAMAVAVAVAVALVQIEATAVAVAMVQIEPVAVALVQIEAGGVTREFNRVAPQDSAWRYARIGLMFLYRNRTLERSPTMAQAKKIRVVVLHDRGVFFDETVTGRKNEPHAMRRALHAAAEIGAGCIMRQTIGARSWSVYEYCEDDGAAHVLTGVPAIRAVEKLESALAGA